ncbi:mono/diheme cytochrome c family protein [Roseimicrobium gellanilyticum]|uniref:Mono/diheme cytochrome c family protein n=1 Tax=Roseimicrobium gellanilyticum TaxID=748857 RepID=A0A366HL02_9BACT|nr:ThuA domain-containing protein [Roseimicrobium gellanilyticum]RBP43610.1 mono/diheme cytochrome c family protein [Roseimicrobium gellanilyticum]
MIKRSLLKSGLRLGALLLALSFTSRTLPAQQRSPAPAVTKSKDAISVLVIGGQNNHDWKIGNEFLLTLLNGQPGIVAEESNTPAKGAPASEWDAWDPQFHKYQCIVLDYNGEMWPQRVKAAFEKYVAEGGSVTLVHAANNSFTGWVEYEKMVGLLWRHTIYGAGIYLEEDGTIVREPAGKGRSSGHGKQWDWQVTVRDTQHPITAGMPRVWKHVKDELYHGQRGPAENVHILLSAFDDAKYQGTGKHEPVLWWVPYGKGKVVTNVMGHVGDSSGPLACVGFQTTFLRSIEWLVTGQCQTSIPGDFPTAERTSRRFPGGIPKEPMRMDLTTTEAMERIQVPEGYRLELVASEPTIVHPVLCTWDGDGHMYVAEMRTYMHDVKATGEDEPLSRVSRLTDTDGDGVLDRTTVFADHLVLPRMVLPLDSRVIIAETYTGKFVTYQDTNGDGIADEKKDFYHGEPTKNNLEHQDTALQWGIDNHLYSGNLSRRFRITSKGMSMEPVQIFGRTSQWGLAMDNQGRFFCSAAGGENPAFGFQQIPTYGSLSFPDETAPGFAETFPGVQTLDTQSGLNRIHNIKGTLNHFSACCGQSIFRGDRLPEELQGDYLLPEPVGRLIRRAKVNNVEGKRVLSNATPGTEFITSTDMAFRPVWTATGPDGCLYIVDMHHGVIQESAWVPPGGYLHDTIINEGYDKYVGHGRIYRLVHKDFKPGESPRMLQETPAQLVQHLSHTNGWWRDTAQKLLVLKGDKSVVPALTELARKGKEPLGRMHALWTLDGLGATDRQLLIDAFHDKDERVRAAAIRISEAYLQKTDEGVMAELEPLLKDPSPDVVVQAVNSLRYVPKKGGHAAIQAAATAHPWNEIITASARQSLQFDPEKPSGISVRIDPVGMALMRKGSEHYQQLCFACHGSDGKGVVTSDGLHLAPPLANSPRVVGSPDALVRIVLHGLMGEVDGKTYPGAMVPMKANDDQWVAEVVTYIRNSFGNNAPTITPAEVKTIRADSDRLEPYTLAELAPYLAVTRDVMTQWAFSASLKDHETKRAWDGDAKSRWSTGTPQRPGQWFQFDMRQPHVLTRIALDSLASKDDYARGYEVRVSDDGEKWSEPIVTGKGAAMTMINFPPKTVSRFVRITQTGSDKGCFWSFNEMAVYGTAEGSEKSK